MIDDNKTAGQHTCPNKLPHGRIGHPYRIILDEEQIPVYGGSGYWFEGLDVLGLHFVPDKRQITGIPVKSGCFEVYLNSKGVNDSGVEVVSTYPLSLVIEDEFIIPLEDTPSDENDPYWKPDETTAIRIVPAAGYGWKKKPAKNMAAASKRGRLHIQTGKFREDDFDMKYDPGNQWYMLAVADGSGAAKYSRRGSQIACETSVEACFEELSTHSPSFDKLAEKFSREKSDAVRLEMADMLYGVIASSVVRAYRDIEQEAVNNACRPDDYATTLLLGVCKRFDFGWFIGAFRVGDGAICVYDKNTWMACLLGIPDGGNRAPEKRFLTMLEIIQPAELLNRVRFIIVNDFSALFLMTNGVSDPKFGTDTDMQYFEQWNKFWMDISAEVDFAGSNKNAGEELLKWLDFWTPGKHDDRTVAVVF